MVYGQALIQAIYRTCLAGDSETPRGTTLVTTVFYVTLISGELVNLVQKLHDLATLSALCHHDNENKRLHILYFHTDQGPHL